MNSNECGRTIKITEDMNVESKEERMANVSKRENGAQQETRAEKKHK
jgi:hypothetical protein